MIKLLARHLLNHDGDETLSKMLWVVIAFVVGGIVWALIIGDKSPILLWFRAVIDSWFDPGSAHGEYGTAIPSNAVNPWAT